MCGRYANSASTAGLYGAFEIDEVIGDDLEPSWNVAPTDAVWAIMERKPRGEDADAAEVRQLRTVRWGLVPSWSKDKKGAARLINARSETVIEKPAFKRAAARRRCLLPADGYFEWQKTPDGKVPYFLHSADDGQLAFAGLYELWPDPSLADDDPARWFWSATVITRQATDTLGEIHDRCPVIVPPELRGPWLDCSTGELAVAAHLLEQMPEPVLEPRIVSSEVNSVRNNGPRLVEPAPPPAS
ncbi:putative SOS response-associated peptidase YedK [Nakamurella sp. UYEF19]|uniref:SOS response-associated peptidase n=1 Tax=Nakamurella sp. UYEF19 TaxID=1756392 RepID=UPI003392D6BB